MVYVDPGVGHTETPRMNRAVQEFLDMHLLHAAPGASSLSATVKRGVLL